MEITTIPELNKAWSDGQSPFDDYLDMLRFLTWYKSSTPYVSSWDDSRYWWARMYLTAEAHIKLLRGLDDGSH